MKFWHVGHKNPSNALRLGFFQCLWDAQGFKPLPPFGSTAYRCDNPRWCPNISTFGAAEQQGHPVLCWRGSSMVISWRVPKIWDLHVKISLGCSSTWFLYGHIYICIDIDIYICIYICVYIYMVRCHHSSRGSDILTGDVYHCYTHQSHPGHP